MNKENKLIADFDFQLVINFFAGLNSQGPGGEKETLKALSFLENTSSQIKIADIGCGTGKQTEVIASNLDCKITAVDIAPKMIAGLNKRIRKENLTNKVSGLVASMCELPFKKNEFDVIWAEGSIYNIGFEKGLREWRQFLKPNGFMAITECCWLSNQRPKDMSFIIENVSEIDMISSKLRIIENSGYKPVAHFILPEYCWIDNFYEITKTRFKEFLEENNYSEPAKDFVERMEHEIEYYQTNKEYFGYVFFICKKTQDQLNH